MAFDRNVGSSGVGSGRGVVDTAGTVETISDLKTYTRPEDVVIVQGYYAAGDGGGGEFYWDSTSTETANDGTIIQATGVTTGRWKRIISNSVDPAMFGALGDDSTDNTTAIQAAMTTGKDIFFNTPGTYILTSVNLASNTTVSGTRGVIMKLPSSASGTSTYMFHITGKTNVVVKGLVFDGNDTGQVGVGHTSAVFIDGASSNITVTENYFKNNTTDSSSVAISSPNSSLTEGVLISNNVFEDVDIGVIAWGGKDVVVTGNRFKTVASEFISLWGDASGGTTFEDNTNWTISGNVMENLTLGQGIVLRTAINVSITGNTMRTLVRRCISFDNFAKYITIAGNTFYEWSSAGTFGAIDENSDTQVDICVIDGNVFTAVSNTNSLGVSQVTGTATKSYFTISNNVFDNLLRSVRFNYGIDHVVTGNMVTGQASDIGFQYDANSDKILLSGNDVQGSNAGFSMSSTNTVIIDNPGWNPVGSSSVSVGASPYTYSTTYYPATLYFTATTSHSATKGGNTVANITGTDYSTIHLGPNESVTYTYSGTPTLIRDAH